MRFRSWIHLNTELFWHKQSINLLLKALKVKSTPKNHLLFDDKMLLLLHSSLRIGVFSTSECCFYVNIFSREGYDKILSSFHSGIRLNKFVNQKSFRDLQYPETLPEPIFFVFWHEKTSKKSKSLCVERLCKNSTIETLFIVELI